MLRLSAIFVFLTAFVYYTNAAVALLPALKKTAEFADQEGCYIKDLNKVIPYGDYYPKNSCYKYTCFPSNITQVVTCGVTVIDEMSPCILISDESRDYPDCCPKVMCSTIPPEASYTKSNDAPEAEHSTTNSASDGTTVPVFEHLSTTEAEPEVPGTSETTLNNDETLNELLIAQETLINNE